MRYPAGMTAQKGSILLEAFIAIVLFSIGILGLVGVQAAAVKNSGEAKNRAEAAYLANAIIGQMWADNPANLGSYAHNAAAGPACSAGGGASTNANVTAWLGNASTPGTVVGNLPGATAALQRISIGANNTVAVTVCWQNPSDATPHNYIGIAQING